MAFWDNANWVNTNPQAQRKIMDLWKLTAKSFNAPNLILIDVNNMNPECSDEEIKFYTFKSLTEAIKANEEKNFVFLEVFHKIPPEYNPVSLKEFIHPPEDVFYVAGSDFGDIPFAELGKQKSNFHFVYIDTKNTIPLWSHTALAVALYDRLIKT
ncbi:MAG: hypothetical protein A2Z35_01975 [Actinobacteria bacterium RBG_19FT_COMBO_36_27]|nr:MAG: hypothetical protein A2Z35_01975 [Actinobacteria bacterium RBG_19FT_COMBO_36_27]